MQERRTKKPPANKISRRLSEHVLLSHSERLQRGLINCGRDVEAVIALVTCNRIARQRSEQTIHVPPVITLLLEGGLHIGNYLVGRHTVVAVDGAVVEIVCVRIVAPGWKPVACIPIIPAAEHKDDARIVASPPPLIVPLRFVVPKHLITCALPVIAS